MERGERPVHGKKNAAVEFWASSSSLCLYGLTGLCVVVAGGLAGKTIPLMMANIMYNNDTKQASSQARQPPSLLAWNAAFKLVELTHVSSSYGLALQFSVVLLSSLAVVSGIEQKCFTWF